jgi:dTDP-4-dehydrorhamnose 3,5-epimerase-like enzyme
MAVRDLGTEGAAVLTSRCFRDGRGSFHEAYTESPNGVTAPSTCTGADRRAAVADRSCWPT